MINNKAVCVIKSDRISAVIRLKEYEKYTIIDGKVTGLNPNQKHAIHIHEYGDMTDGCASSCLHYNPFNMDHGGPASSVRGCRTKFKC